MRVQSFQCMLALPIDDAPSKQYADMHQNTQIYPVIDAYSTNTDRHRDPQIFVALCLGKKKSILGGPPYGQNLWLSVRKSADPS